jgi:hypothetical protein
MLDFFMQAALNAFETKMNDPGKQEENAWSAEICNTYRTIDPRAETSVNRKYPGSSLRYDIRIEDGSGRTLYAETKGAWLSYWMDKGQLLKFRDYLMAPLNGRPRPSNSAVLDLEKLEQHVPLDADWVALVLFGSHRAEHEIAPYLDEFERLAQLGCAPWNSERRQYPNRWYPGYSYDVRVWICPRSDFSAWWQAVSRAMGGGRYR